MVSGATGGNKDRGTCLASRGFFQGGRHDRHGISLGLANCAVFRSQGFQCQIRLPDQPEAMARVLSVFFAASVQLCAANEILLASFDGAKGSTHQWRQMNDPVMGGKSTGAFSVADNKGVFSGEVVDVPFLKAPGFIKASVVDMNPFGRIFPDISTCKNIALTVKSANDYKGFRFSIGNAHAPGGKFFAYGYKSDFNAGPAGQVNTVTLPLTGFTDYWDDATGAAIKTCQDDKIYCPDAKTLKDMRTMGVWAEGVAGTVHLEILSIKATECESSQMII